MSDRQNPSVYRSGENSLESKRQSALDSITEAFAHDKIPLEDYEKLANLIQNAKSEDEISTLAVPAVLDRGGTAASYAEPEAAESRLTSPSWDGRGGAGDFSLCIMSERRLSGDWLESEKTTSVTLMGSTVLDLRDLALPPGKLRIDAIAIMGETRIIVPPDLPVKMSAFPFMGEARVHGSVPRRIDKSKPWVEVSGLAFMGSIVVIPEK